LSMLMSLPVVSAGVAAASGISNASARAFISCLSP
jgi:hypothetical protein